MAIDLHGVLGTVVREVPVPPNAFVHFLHNQDEWKFVFVSASGEAESAAHVDELSIAFHCAVLAVGVSGAALASEWVEPG